MTDNQITKATTASLLPVGMLAQAAETALGTKKHRILVVDDEPSVTRLLKLNLEQTNQYEVATVNVPELTLEAAERFRPDLIFLDVLMPGEDGGELARRIQAHPDLKSVPIVFLTAIVTKADIVRGDGRIGGMPFLAKPVDLAAVLGCLKKMLD